MDNKIGTQKTRRAKRTKKWLADGNILPLSSVERKKLENAFYYQERKSNKEKDSLGYVNYRYDQLKKRKWLAESNIITITPKERKRLENASCTNKNCLGDDNLKFNLEYKNDMFNYLEEFDFNLKGSLTYRNNITMFGAYKDAYYIFETLLKRGIINSYFIGVEYADNHVHTHYVVDDNGLTKDQYDKYIYQIFSIKKGYNYSEQITDKEESLFYIIDKLNTNNKQRQSQIDYWFYNTSNTQVT